MNSHPRHDDHTVWVRHAEPDRRAIAISSQTGSGAMRIAQLLAALLQAQTESSNSRWKVFDKDLMLKVIEDHHLPAHLAHLVREDAAGALDDMIEELFGLHPPSGLIVQKSIETILRLVGQGSVILVGWGANVITSKLPNVFQVRLVGSLERRLERIEQRDRLSRKEALGMIARQDRGRERYVKRYFGHELSNSLLYHLTINTDRFTDEAAARLICDSALDQIRGSHPWPSDFARQRF